MTACLQSTGENPGRRGQRPWSCSIDSNFVPSNDSLPANHRENPGRRGQQYQPRKVSLMKWSETGIKTLREAPAIAVLPGHRLLLRGGFIKPVSAGLWTYSPLLLRAIKKFEDIVREELNKTSCAEMLMPLVQPKELWEQSGRWNQYDDILQRIKSRTGRDFCLGPTHEEVITDYVRNNIKSYRDLPFCLYQIQTKFRDEIRPRFGLMRAKEFIMKDAYSFDLTEQKAKERYQNMRSVYNIIFSRLGVPFRVVQARSGEIGGDQSEEFHILADHGEDELIWTDTFSANKELYPSAKKGDIWKDGKPLQLCRGIEVGHIFYLGDKYSNKMNVHYVDSQGNKQTVKMGCYGIGITRCVQAVVEQSHDPEGIIWPPAISPFQLEICLLDPQDSKTASVAHKLYKSLWEKGVDVFLDDRADKPGVKFKDADLLGFPIRVNMGVRDIKQDLAEVVERQTGKREKLSLSSLETSILKALNK